MCDEGHRKKKAPVRRGRLTKPAFKLTANLIFENLFHLSHFLLHLAADLFVGAFVLQARIVGGVAHLLFHFSLRFVERAFRLVFRAVVHRILQLNVVADTIFSPDAPRNEYSR
jgi:hypothetical protein